MASSTTGASCSVGVVGNGGEVGGVVVTAVVVGAAVGGGVVGAAVVGTGVLGTVVRANVVVAGGTVVGRTVVGGAVVGGAMVEAMLVGGVVADAAVAVELGTVDDEDTCSSSLHDAVAAMRTISVSVRVFDMVVPYPRPTPMAGTDRRAAGPATGAGCG